MTPLPKPKPPTALERVKFRSFWLGAISSLAGFATLQVLLERVNRPRPCSDAPDLPAPIAIDNARDDGKGASR